jgi:hypothetical protein
VQGAGLSAFADMFALLVHAILGEAGLKLIVATLAIAIAFSHERILGWSSTDVDDRTNNSL